MEYCKVIWYFFENLILLNLRLETIQKFRNAIFSILSPFYVVLYIRKTLYWMQLKVTDSTPKNFQRIFSQKQTVINLLLPLSFQQTICSSEISFCFHFSFKSISNPMIWFITNPEKLLTPSWTVKNSDTFINALEPLLPFSRDTIQLNIRNCYSFKGPQTMKDNKSFFFYMKFKEQLQG